MIEDGEAESFRENHLWKSPLFGKFDASLCNSVNLHTLMEVLKSGNVPGSLLRLVSSENFYSRGFTGFMESPRHGNSPIKWPVLKQCVEDGCSLILDRCEKFFPEVKIICSHFASTFKCVSQANLYLSYKNSPGFNFHFDDHDVIAFQLDGSKRWELSGPTLAFPASGDKSIVLQPPLSEFHRKVMLKVGDFLYVPMGHWHRVTTETSYSLHVSFVLDFPRRYDILERLKLELQKDEYFRRPEFIGVQRTTGDATELKQRLVRAIENWSMPLPSHSATNQEPSFNLGQLNAQKTR